MKLCSILTISLMASLLISGCKKYLDRKPTSNMLAPTAPDDLQGLLDNTDVFGYGHILGVLSGDEFAFTQVFYNDKLTEWERNAYKWDRDIFSPSQIPYEWTKSYEQIFNTNIALEGLVPLMSQNTDERDLN